MASQPKKTSTKKPAAPRQKLNWRDRADAFDLAEFYASEDAKRAFGGICLAVNVQGKQVALLGAAHKPLAMLSPAAAIPASQFEVSISIDDAKANWSSVTAAVLFFGTAFRISGTNFDHAVLQRHAINRHPAHRYRRPQLEDIPQNLDLLIDDMREMTDRFSKTTSLIDRRFREVWRDKNLGRPS